MRGIDIDKTNRILCTDIDTVNRQIQTDIDVRNIQIQVGRQTQTLTNNQIDIDIMKTQYPVNE